MNGLQRFVSRYAAEVGGRARLKGADVELLLPDRDPLVVHAETDGERVPQDRLKMIEKEAAIALLAETGLFALTVLDRGGRRRRDALLLRVAFGYYVINGRRCCQRFTAYFEPGSGQAATLRGDDRLFSEDSNTEEVVLDRQLIRTHTPEIVSLVRGAYDAYVTDARQVAEFQAMAERRRDRLFELELLYARKSRRHIRTYGVDPRDSASRPPSATEEYRRRKMSVLRKYLPRVGVNLLSVGVIETPAKRRRGQLLAPFLPDPEDRRWLAPWQPLDQ